MAKQTSARFIEGDFDNLVEMSLKLHALLIVTYGESGEAFRGLSGEIQDAYLWACSDMAGQLKEVAKRVEVGHG